MSTKLSNYTVNYDRIWIFDKIHHFGNQYCSVHTLPEVYIDHFDGKVDDILAESLQRDCDIWAPGIQIISVRVTKPTLPSAIAANYHAMESEKRHSCEVSNETRKRTLIEAETAQRKALLEAETLHNQTLLRAETERQKAVIEAEQDAQVSKIAMERRIAEHEAAKRVTTIDAEASAQRIRVVAEAEEFAILRLSLAEKQRFTERLH